MLQTSNDELALFKSAKLMVLIGRTLCNADSVENVFNHIISPQVCKTGHLNFQKYTKFWAHITMYVSTFILLVIIRKITNMLKF